jgi:A/G-specific adenine glycosylase
MVRRLLDWFATAARPMPWRLTADPYAVWVSEIMLQQTQVRTVIPYWERWMAKFPTVEALANADEGEVLKLWEGLGYYSRARRLLAGARKIVADGGIPPDSYDGWRAIPGIGPYTAGAITSIAFDKPAPAVDGNVIRVACRVFAISGNPASTEVGRRVRDLATRWVNAADALPRKQGAPALRPCSALNQALMELGATVCLPGTPSCAACPVAERCVAHCSGRESKFPEPSPRPKLTRLDYAVVVLRRGDVWWVRQRPPGGVNAGLWEFPSLEVPAGGSAATVAGNWMGGRALSLAAAPPLRHSITRYQVFFHPFHVESPDIDPPGPGRWAARAELESLALTGAHRKLAARLVRQGE